MSSEASHGPARPRRERCRRSPRHRTGAKHPTAAPFVALLILGAVLAAVPAHAQDTLPTVEPNPPWGLSVEPGVEALHLDWEPPNGTVDGNLSGYRIYRGETADSLQLHDQVDETRYDDTGLGDDVTYFYRVHAAYADTNEGDGTRIRHATTHARPSVPRNVSALAGPLPGNVTLNWTAPADDGGTNVTAYNVTARNATGDPTANWTVPANRTELVHGNLSAGVTRHYTIAAENAAGLGEASDPVQATTWSRPSAPTAVSASTGPGAGEITVNWSAPIDPGGTNLTAYVVHREDPDGSLQPVATTHPDADGVVVDGLDPGTTTAYRVAAENPVGVGNRSDPVQATTHDVPSEPSIDATTGPGLGNVTIRWSPPADDGGLDVERYQLYRRADDDWTGIAVLDADVTEHRDTGLAANTSFGYAIAAINPAGQGNLSPADTARTLALPAPPVGANASTGPEAGQITLTWSAPTLQDGTVTGYAIELRQGGGWQEIDRVDAEATSYVLDDLPADTSRVLAVRTIADLGAGRASEAVSATTYATPSAPTDLEATVDDGTVDLTWAAPTGGELNLTGYRLDRRAGADASWESIADLDPDTTRTLDDDPVPDVEIAYRVAAVNAAGEGPPSEPATVTVTTPDAGSTAPADTDTDPTDDPATGSGATVDPSRGAGTDASALSLTGLGLFGALGLGVVLVALAAVMTRPTEEQRFTILGGSTEPEPEVAATATTVPVAALPDPERFEAPEPEGALSDRLRDLTIPTAPEPLAAVRGRLQDRLLALRDHARAGHATAADVDALERDVDRFAELVETFEVARRRVDATADAVAASPPSTADATAAGLRSALRQRARVETEAIDAAQTRVDDLDRWSRHVADARDRLVAWSNHAADADVAEHRRDAMTAFWQRLVGRLLARRRPEPGLGDVLDLRVAARAGALARLEQVDDHVAADAREALAARVAGAAALVDALEAADDATARPILDRLDAVADAGLLGPALADLATGKAPADLDELIARQDRILAVEVPRLVGEPTADAADARVADRLAEVAVRSSDSPREAARAYVAGKTADLDDVDAWLVDAVTTAHALALPGGEEAPGFDGAVAEAIASDLHRFDVVHRDRLARRLVAARADVDAVLAEMAADGRIVVDDETGLVGRPTRLDADRIHQLRRRHDGIPDEHLTAFIQTLQSEGEDDA